VRFEEPGLRRAQRLNQWCYVGYNPTVIYASNEKKSSSGERKSAIPPSQSERAAAHLRSAARYERNGQFRKAAAHFGRAMRYGAAFNGLMSSGLIQMFIERALTSCLRGNAISEYGMLARLAQTSRQFHDIIHAKAIFFKVSTGALLTHPLYARAARMLAKLSVSDWLMSAYAPAPSGDGAHLTAAMNQIRARSISEWYHLRPGQFHPLVRTYRGASVSDPPLSQKCGAMLDAFMSHLDSDECAECAILQRPVPREQIRDIIRGRFTPTAIGQEGTMPSTHPNAGTPIRRLVRAYAIDPPAHDGTYGHLCVWNTCAVTDMSSMFLNVNVLLPGVWSDQEHDARLWDTSRVTSMHNAFGFCEGRFSGVEHWDVSAVTNMDSMFSFARNFNRGIGNWDTSSVRNMASMFRNATAFNRDISTWDTSRVRTMHAMFLSMAFDRDIGDWDTSEVVSMSYMFYQAASFNQDLLRWKTGNVQDMTAMFQLATAFNGDIGSWDTSRVRLMPHMFAGAAAFNRSIGSWDTAQVRDMDYMFSLARAFSFQSDIVEKWARGKAKNTHTMFEAPGGEARRREMRNLAAWNSSP
jgi:surface protein